MPSFGNRRPVHELAARRGLNLPVLYNLRPERMHGRKASLNPGPHCNGLARAYRMPKSHSEFRRHAGVTVCEQAIRHRAVEEWRDHATMEYVCMAFEDLVAVKTGLYATSSNAENSKRRPRSFEGLQTTQLE